MRSRIGRGRLTAPGTLSADRSARHADGTFGAGCALGIIAGGTSAAGTAGRGREFLCGRVRQHRPEPPCGTGTHTAQPCATRVAPNPHDLSVASHERGWCAGSPSAGTRSPGTDSASGGRGRPRTGCGERRARQRRARRPDDARWPSHGVGYIGGRWRTRRWRRPGGFEHRRGSERRPDYGPRACVHHRESRRDRRGRASGTRARLSGNGIRPPGGFRSGVVRADRSGCGEIGAVAGGRAAAGCRGVG